MPKRILDGDALWGSSKLERCEEWTIPEYAWLYPLADGNGSFEITNPRVIHGKVSAIRPHFSIDDLRKVFHEFNRMGLMFVWRVGEKTYAHWTGSDRPGRLPAPSERRRYQLLAPEVPKPLLQKYIEESHDNIARNSRGTLDLIGTSVGVGMGVGFGLGLGMVLEGIRQGGGAVGSSVEVTEKRFQQSTDISTTTAAAYLSIGFDKPFGQPAFQEVWERNFEARQSDPASPDFRWVTDVMEATIQECYQKNIGIPPQFFEAKHDVEKRELVEAQNRYRTAS
jgi:hypothetical protein